MDKRQEQKHAVQALPPGIQKRFAWSKAGKVLPEQVYAWGEKAREKKKEYEEGKITSEEFEVWLKKIE